MDVHLHRRCFRDGSDGGPGYGCRRATRVGDGHRRRIRFSSEISRRVHVLPSRPTFPSSSFSCIAFLLSVITIFFLPAACGRPSPTGDRTGQQRRSFMDAGYGFVEIGRFSSMEDSNVTAVHYRHSATLADFISVSNHDPKKYFGMAFKTLPTDDYGAAHVLEHCILSGSDKYPVTNILSELYKHSFVDAGAYVQNDHTVYHITSSNTKDLYNVLDVWWDGIFHPLVLKEELVFMRHGWNYNLQSSNDNLTVEGVALNEMKWVFSNDWNVAYKARLKAAFPNTPYAYVAGGDPFQIRNLTYSSLKHFYWRFYHPSNSFILMYGDDDPTQRLRVLGGLLSNFTLNEHVRKHSALQPMATAPDGGVPRSVTATYHPNRINDTTFSIIWVLDAAAALDMEKRFELEILGVVLQDILPIRLHRLSSVSVLVDNYESPIIYMEFTNSSSATSPPILDTVLAVLGNISTQGNDGMIPIDSAAHNTLDRFFGQKEIEDVEYSDKKGDTILADMVAFWKRGGNPLQSLNRSRAHTSVYEKMFHSNESILAAIIRDLILSNENVILIDGKPSSVSILDAQEAIDKALLERQRAMTPTDINELVNKTKTLEDFSRPRGAVANSVLPSLTVEDLNIIVPKENDKVHDIQGVRVVENYLDTNGVFYVDVAFNLGNLPQEFLPYAVALSNTWTFLRPSAIHGAEDVEDYERNISVWSVWTSFKFYDGGLKQARGTVNGSAYLLVSGKALSRHATSLVNLIRILLTDVELDERETFAAVDGSYRLTGADSYGYTFLLRSRLAGKDSFQGWFRESTSGYRAAASTAEVKALTYGYVSWTGALAAIREAHRLMVHSGAASISLIGDASTIQSVQSAVTTLVASLPPPPTTFRVARQNDWMNDELEGFAANESFPISALVYFNGRSRNVYKVGWSPSGSGHVIAQVLSIWVFTKVQAQKLAYSGGSIFDASTGLVLYESNRDPRILSSLQTFDDSAKYLRTMTELDEDLKQVIAVTLGQLNDVRSPYDEGLNRFQNFLTNVSTADYELRNAEIALTSLKDFHEFGAALAWSDAYTAVAASPKALMAAEAQQPSLKFTEVYRNY